MMMYPYQHYIVNTIKRNGFFDPVKEDITLREKAQLDELITAGIVAQEKGTTHFVFVISSGA